MLRRFYFLACVLGLLTSCSDSSSSTMLEGHVKGLQYEGKMVYLTSIDSTTLSLDSALVEQSRFKLNLGDSLRLYNLVLRTSQSDMFPIVLPIVGGEGKVKAYLGSKVVTTGTASNDALQDFLIASDQIFDKLVNSNQTTDQVKVQFKEFLVGQVKLNQKNIVSAYILRIFKSKFSDEEYDELKGLISNSYVSLLY